MTIEAPGLIVGFLLGCLIAAGLGAWLDRRRKR